MELKRYDSVRLIESPDGAVVRFEDAQTIVADLRNELRITEGDLAAADARLSSDAHATKAANELLDAVRHWIRIRRGVEIDDEQRAIQAVIDAADAAHILEEF